MPTLWSQTLIPTARQVPAEAEVPSHQLMLRAGLIRKLGAGVYDYLPLGLRSLRKAMEIIRQEMNAAGAVEVMLPALQPIELWERTGRRAAYGPNLFIVKDRHGRDQALGPTHEEVVTELVGGCVESYRQLPLCLYQIQTKFRDEFRPRFGVLRSREFQMKDAYSFHLTLEGPGGLDETYQKQYDAYCRIFSRCGLPYMTVEAESGPIGGSASHEFMVPSPTGEDTILVDEKANYAANVEKCATGPRGHSFDGPPTGELDKVHTPNCPGIEDVGKLLKVKPKHMLKTLVFFGIRMKKDEVPVLHGSGLPGVGNDLKSLAQHDCLRFVIAVVRGDHDVNEAKLRHQFFALYPEFDTLVLGDPRLAQEMGFTIGYVGPQVIAGSPWQKQTLLMVDPDAAQPEFWVTGANDVDHHVRHFNWNREVRDPLGDHVQKHLVVADIRNAAEGDPSPRGNGGVLKQRKGIEIGHVFKLGAKYSDAMGVTVLNERNERVPMIMGCYGIGVNRILASAIERENGNDANGIIWPASIAPYQVLITPIKYDGAMKDAAGSLASSLESLGIDVLIDDRDERPGVKFKDADLVGFPLRITIGDKSLATGQVEVKARNGSNGEKGELVAVDQAAARVAELLKSL
ncbi:MAG: proline--tRNA ligase [Phycisphaeraceae bacterium]